MEVHNNCMSVLSAASLALHKVLKIGCLFLLLLAYFAETAPLKERYPPEKFRGYTLAMRQQISAHGLGFQEDHIDVPHDGASLVWNSGIKMVRR